MKKLLKIVNIIKTGPAPSPPPPPPTPAPEPAREGPLSSLRCSSESKRDFLDIDFNAHPIDFSSDFDDLSQVVGPPPPAEHVGVDGDQPMILTSPAVENDRASRHEEVNVGSNSDPDDEAPGGADQVDNEITSPQNKILGRLEMLAEAARLVEEADEKKKLLPMSSSSDNQDQLNESTQGGVGTRELPPPPPDNLKKLDDLEKNNEAGGVSKVGVEYSAAEALSSPSSPPVVRSKRGRALVMPSKYRDSVVETYTAVPNRRRSRSRRD